MTSRNLSGAKSGDLPECFSQLNECPRKGVQAAVGILLSEKCPVASLPIRGRRGDGIFNLKTNLECAPRAQRRRLERKRLACIHAEYQSQSGKRGSLPSSQRS